jgi:hypothetical protein
VGKNMEQKRVKEMHGTEIRRSKLEVEKKPPRREIKDEKTRKRDETLAVRLLLFFDDHGELIPIPDLIHLPAFGASSCWFAARFWIPILYCQSCRGADPTTTDT